MPTNYETLDLDRADRRTLQRVIYKVEKMGCRVLGISISPSLNGYHVEVDCRCGACRLVWDDPERLAKDLHRPLLSRNVLFDVRRRRTYMGDNCELTSIPAGRDGLPLR
jgi:hypothetical protein